MVLMIKAKIRYRYLIKSAGSIHLLHLGQVQRLLLATQPKEIGHILSEDTINKLHSWAGTYQYGTATYRTNREKRLSS